jgi:hypothetical protein
MERDFVKSFVNLMLKFTKLTTVSCSTLESIGLQSQDNFI